MGETHQIIVRFSDGQAHSVKYSSSNSSNCRVTSGGLITARKTKTTYITVTDEFGESIRIKVIIKKAPSKISISPKSAKLYVGQTGSVKATVNSGAASKITYTSGNTAVATVDENGLITAVSEGSVKISAKTFNKKNIAMTLTVVPAPESIAFAQDEIVLGVGESHTLSSKTAPVDVGSRSYYTEDSDILSVDAASGKIVALATGTATVYVQSENGKIGSCAVIVKNEPSCISIGVSSITIGVGEKLTLPDVQIGEDGEDCAGSYSLKSSNTRYVTISGGTQICGRKVGKSTVTATTYNGRTARISVTVKKAPSRLTMNRSTLTLGIEQTYTLCATPNSGAVGSIGYTSSNPSVATVDASSGAVVAVSVGTTTITAKSHNGKTAKCSVSVKDAPESIDFASAEVEMGMGETRTLKYVLSENSAAEVRFESDDPAVATVDASTGKVTAVSVGSVTLRAKTHNGKTAECILIVKNAPTGVSIAENTITIAQGDSYRLNPALLGENTTSAFSYSSANRKYVSVSSDGLITGQRSGKSVRITVKTYNGKSDSVTVKVVSAAKSIKFTDSSLYMCIGTQRTPGVKTNVSCSYTLSSSNPSVLKIADDGKSVIAVSGGTAVLTAKTYNGKTATLNVTVPYLPDSIALSPETITLGVGDGMALTPVMPEGQDSVLTYSSDNEAAASVDESGNITANAVGAAVISVKTTNNLVATSVVCVKEAPTGISLNPESAAMCIDEAELQLSVRFANEGEGGRYTFNSSNTNIATVSQSGLVRFKSVGTTDIRVTTYNGFSAVCHLTIGEKPTKMYFDSTEYTVALGDSVSPAVLFDKGCESYAVRIEDESFADASGASVCGKAIGSTKITAKSRSGLSAESTLTIVEAPTGVELSHSEMTYTVGTANESLTATALPNGIGSVYFSSSDPSIAIVDRLTGEITPVSFGECVITATTYNGYSAECALSVHGLLEGVRIGIDPGHQRKANYSKEAVAPGSSTKKARVSSGAGGKYTHIPEYKTNLQISLLLRDSLVALGAEVYMTRETHDVDISNQERAKMMNELNVDVVLRIHCNSISNSKANGMSIYVRKTGVGKEESAGYARLILKHMSANTGAKNLGVKYSDKYTGLNWSTVPSMLLELGYLSNKTEDYALNNADYQEQLVRGMVSGICEYLERPLPTFD